MNMNIGSFKDIRCDTKEKQKEKDIFKKIIFDIFCYESLQQTTRKYFVCFFEVQ